MRPGAIFTLPSTFAHLSLASIYGAPQVHVAVHYRTAADGASFSIGTTCTFCVQRQDGGGKGFDCFTLPISGKGVPYMRRKTYIEMCKC